MVEAIFPRHFRLLWQWIITITRHPVCSEALQDILIRAAVTNAADILNAQCPEHVIQFLWGRWLAIDVAVGIFQSIFVKTNQIRRFHHRHTTIYTTPVFDIEISGNILKIAIGWHETSLRVDYDNARWGHLTTYLMVKAIAWEINSRVV